MTVQFETQVSHVRTAFLWDLSLDMQPCLTSSALLSMAASAASLLAPTTHSTTRSLTRAALLDTVAQGPRQLPSTSQMTQSPTCGMLQLSVAVATGMLSISCSGENLMQSRLAQTGTDSSCARAAQEGPAGDSPRPLASFVSLLMNEVHVAKPAAAFAHVTCQAQDESGFLHPAVFEIPVSLAVLAAQPGKAQPTWLRSAAATLLPTGSATTGFVASNAPSSNKAWSTDHQPVLQQEGMVFASGLALSASELSVKEAAAAAATGIAGHDVTQDQEACDQVVSADSALLQMDSQERKLYIQAQVCIGLAV